MDKTKKKEACKKVIAAMTVGKDVSMLFPSVVNWYVTDFCKLHVFSLCPENIEHFDLIGLYSMQTDDLELKKLVYLYSINYAKTQPDLAIMGVNTFVKVKNLDQKNIILSLCANFKRL